MDVRRTEEVGPTVSAVERLWGDYGAGRFAWKLANPKLFPEPFAYRGALGLFNVFEKDLVGAEAVVIQAGMAL